MIQRMGKWPVIVCLIVVSSCLIEIFVSWRAPKMLVPVRAPFWLGDVTLVQPLVGRQARTWIRVSEDRIDAVTDDMSLGEEVKVRGGFVLPA